MLNHIGKLLRKFVFSVSLLLLILLGLKNFKQAQGSLVYVRPSFPTSTPHELPSNIVLIIILSSMVFLN